MMIVVVVSNVVSEQIIFFFHSIHSLPRSGIHSIATHITYYIIDKQAAIHIIGLDPVFTEFQEI